MFAEPPAVRVALALGDQELEQRLRPALETAAGVEIAAHCLAADQLLDVVQARQVDILVVAWGLHRLSDTALAQLERARLPLLLLVPDTNDERWLQRHAVVLPLRIDADALLAAVHAAARGERPHPSRQPAVVDVRSDPEAEPLDPYQLGVIAVAGGAGSPGRTTVAINLATALGSVAPTVLVDADLTSPAIAAYLDRDPSRNLCTLAHAVREAPQVWNRALEEELQPLHARCSGGVVLCGLPKREMRSSLSAGLLDQLVAEFSLRYRYVVLDVGAELLGLDTVPTLHRAALLVAHHILLVTAPDLVGLWHTRTVLGQLERQLEIPRRRLSLVINRHDPRHHHTRAEIEWHIGYPTAAVVPYDYASVQRAVGEQYPLVTDPRSRAGRALIGLAERVHHGRVRLPAPHEPVEPPPGIWTRLKHRLSRSKRGRSNRSRVGAAW